MKSLFATVTIVLFACSGCRSLPSNVLVRIEGQLPTQWTGNTADVRVQYSTFCGQHIVTATICPETGR